jgi:hypothetical protein
VVAISGENAINAIGFDAKPMMESHLPGILSHHLTSIAASSEFRRWRLYLAERSDKRLLRLPA